MTNSLRIILIIGSVAFMIYLLGNLRKTKISIDMSVIWIVISCLIVLMAIFPQPFIYLMNLIGVESAVNGILVFFTLILLLLVYFLFKKIAILEFKLTELVQKIGIDEHKKGNK